MSVMVCDIETSVVGSRPNPEVDILKFVGFRESTGVKRMFSADQRSEIQYGLATARFIVGHNFREYDAVVLKRYGFKIYPSIIIDTLEITQRRVKSMMYIDLTQQQMSLGALAKQFNLTTMKGEIDYDIFKQETFTEEDLREIKTYLDGDLDTSYYLFKYYYDFFIGFKDFVSEENINRMAWLTASPGGVAYKAVCNMAGLLEEYDDADDEEEIGIQYKGAFVAEPEVEFVEGDIYVADFSSLYPHMYMGGCLYSPEEGGWHGSGMFESVEDNPEDGIVGYYSRTRGKIENTIKDLYNLRVSIRAEMKDMYPGSPEYVRADARQLATKIIINTIYGISGSRRFKNVFSLVTAADCTSMARMAIKHGREYLTEKGFQCIYTDTDSVYFKDPYHNPSYVKHVCATITDIQRASFNVDIETHDFEIEAKIEHMYFFKNDKGEFVKKLYIYKKDNGGITLKGIPLVRGTVSDLAKDVYTTNILPLINSGDDVMLGFDAIGKMISNLITVDNIKKRFRVRDLSEYKTVSSIQSQIAEKYGEGEHWLIPNNRVGAGKDVMYGTLKELKEYGNPLDFVDIRKYIGELKHFIPWNDRKKIKILGQRHVCKSFVQVGDNPSPLQQNVICRTCGDTYLRMKIKKSMKWVYFKESDRNG